MNIFILDSDPILAARYVFDSHAIKMPLEGLQMLSTNVRIILDIEDDNLMKSTHANHPSSIWARESSANFAWLVAHTGELFKEYTRRYGKVHQSETRYHSLIPLFDMCQDELDSQGKSHLTPFAMAMPDELKSDDVVASYHNYYAYKANLEHEKIDTYKAMLQLGIKARKPVLRFVWNKTTIPSWAVGKVLTASL